MKQLNLLIQDPPPLLYFGGSLGLEKSLKINGPLGAENISEINHHPYVSPKRSIRPLSTKNPTHLVLKAQKSFNLYKNKQIIQQIVRKQAKAFGIKIYGFSIQKDHIHFNIRIFSRDMYKRFIRAITGLIARKLRKGIWKFRPFTRIVKWGRAFQILKKYILQNELEIRGLIPKQKRKHKYKMTSDLNFYRGDR